MINQSLQQPSLFSWALGVKAVVFSALERVKCTVGRSLQVQVMGKRRKKHVAWYAHFSQSSYMACIKHPNDMRGGEDFPHDHTGVWKHTKPKVIPFCHQNIALISVYVFKLFWKSSWSHFYRIQQQKTMPSFNLTKELSLKRRFSGLRSLCAMFSEWQCCKAKAIWKRAQQISCNYRTLPSAWRVIVFLSFQSPLKKTLPTQPRPQPF